jgi:hypothetical protein
VINDPDLVERERFSDVLLDDKEKPCFPGIAAEFFQCFQITGP